MRVLWLAHAIPYPPIAGFLLRSYNLLREIARRHTVDLIAFVQEPWIQTSFPNVDAGLEASRLALSQFCRNVTFLPIHKLKHPWGKQLTGLKAFLSGSTYTTSWLVSNSARRVIANQLRTQAYDLVHFDTIGLAPYRNLAASLPATLTHHNIESHMMLRRAENSTNPLARSYFRHEGSLLRSIEQHYARSFAAHITCSELDSIRLRELMPDAHIVVVPNGVDCEFFRSERRQIRPGSLIFVGTMNWYPNVQAMNFFLRDIWPGLKARVPEVTMDIAGSNPPEPLTQLAHSLPDVTVHGYLADIRPLLDSAAIFICPIQDGGGTKLKILDALAMRKCVVAHPIACEGIDVTPGEDVVLASTAQEFIDKITALLGDTSRREALGNAGRRLVESQYSYREIGARLATTFETVARGNAAPH
jgi:glycosyltransferase involved in cell wall biosynthesis